MRTGHADVGLVGRAVLEDLFVGGGDVGVGAEHGRDAAVEIATQKLFVAGRLGMDVNDDDPGARCRFARESGRWHGTGNRPAS